MGIHSRSLKLVARLFASSHEEQAETATGLARPYCEVGYGPDY